VKFLRELDAVGRGIHDPAAKLRYVRTSLDEFGGLERLCDAGALPGAWLRGWLAFGASRHPTARLGRGILMAASLAVASGVGATAYRLWRHPVGEPALAAAAAPVVAEPLAPRRAGVVPGDVWLVEKGPGFEQYSNGLRIETGMAVSGEARRYRVVDMSTGERAEVADKPAGILFHTSESDIWPMEAAYNENLRGSSQKLIRYLRRNRVYHYLIDRFGRVFRVVEESSRANHAGHSIWAREQRVYLNLNSAFLGVSFETRWEGGHALPITQAQLESGRSLTDYLRHRYAIPAEMCVAHGLTSVNPKKHLIGHHLDWARGFPFEAFGLPDQYGRAAPSVAVFGFGYDDDFLKALGEPWAGVLEAERALGRDAALRGTSVEELRQQRRALYDRWLAEQAVDDERRDGTGAALAEVASVRGGG
jgi:hypothetical protein